MFYRVGDWDGLQIDLHVSLHDGFKIQFAGIVPVFLEFNGFSLVIPLTHADIVILLIHADVKTF